jgi:hypothetical protein
MLQQCIPALREERLWRALFFCKSRTEKRQSARNAAWRFLFRRMFWPFASLLPLDHASPTLTTVRPP